MDMLGQAARWLDGVRQKSLSAPAVYRRRGGETFAVNVTIGKTLFRSENEYGVTIRLVSCDFLTSNLPIAPERGDRIIYLERQYEVLAPNGEPVWRWSGKAKRIHTKEMGVI